MKKNNKKAAASQQEFQQSAVTTLTERGSTMNTTIQEKPVDKVHSLIEEVKAGVASIQSSEEWVRFLDVSSRFWRYSFHNQMLIALQRPNATLVAGFNAWKEMGRFVKQGEHGIRILAPMLVKVKPEDPDSEEERIVRFKSVAVFDVSQTEGTELPEMHHPLKGEAPMGVLIRVKKFIENHGYTVRYEETPEGTYGFVNASKEIVLREGESMAQTLDTLCHEVSHALLGHVGDSSLSREEKELEAETAAWVVCRNLGLETRDGSFSYLAIWVSDKDRDAKLERAAHRACEVAKVILEGVEQIAVLAGQG